ncbi:MAG: glycosyltransferase, partial [Clostridia bacterium]|nr:glycosyltransferase [Clostridia bacterium]
MYYEVRRGLTVHSNNNQTPIVSVIVPVYNVEAYLERCIASLISQTLENIEIILVD